MLFRSKRDHIAGNCYTEKVEGINVHKYGAHIFHTSNKVVWDYVNRFTEFNNFINSPKAFHQDKLYSLPFNMNTFYELWGVTTPEEAERIINKQRFKGTPKNLEEQALSLVGDDIYYTLIKGYTEKQWGRKATELPSFIIKRLPLRYTFNNNYFNDRYQGIPVNGYTDMFERMLDGIEVQLNVDYFSDRDYYDSLAEKVVYTGCIDEFFDYEYGELQYRSLNFEEYIVDVENYQGNAVINYCDDSTSFTRLIEHKHFENSTSSKTVVSYEYPCEYVKGATPFYPINTDNNQGLYRKYKDKTTSLTKYVFGGRLSEYKYMDMHVVIESAMNKFKSSNG